MTYYVSVTKDQPLQQGDILYPVPMIVVPRLDDIPVITNKNEYIADSWDNIHSSAHVISPLPLEKVWGIVCSQNCDASRVPVISCFRVDTFRKVTNIQLSDKPNKRASTIISHSRSNGKWFYLPADNSLGFLEPMAAMFDVVFQIHRESLIAKIEEYRKYRLNTVAYEHYRECIAQYFRRYPYEEWYSLTPEEFQEYKQKITDQEEQEKVNPFDWQK